MLEQPEGLGLHLAEDVVKDFVGEELLIHKRVKHDVVSSSDPVLIEHKNEGTKGLATTHLRFYVPLCPAGTSSAAASGTG